jgi:hypothetical protein
MIQVETYWYIIDGKEILSCSVIKINYKKITFKNQNTKPQKTVAMLRRTFIIFTKQEPPRKAVQDAVQGST